MMPANIATKQDSYQSNGGRPSAAEK
jgi:hypothetical protein